MTLLDANMYKGPQTGIQGKQDAVSSMSFEHLNAYTVF